MKILVVCQYYYPERFLVTEVAEALAARGHHVDVLTGLPNYPSGSVPAEYKRRRRRTETVNGVRIKRCFEFGRGTGRVRLLLNYLSYMASASYAASTLHGDYDVVFSYQLSPITMVVPAITFKRRTGARLVLYCLDIWPESARAHISNPAGLLYRVATALSKRTYNACDRILVSSAPFSEYLQQVDGVPPEKIAYLPQHADAVLMETDLSKRDNKTVDFMFAGNIGYGQNLDTIILAFAELEKSEDIRLHFVGDGSRANHLKEMAVTHGVADRTVFHGAHPRSEMASLYRKADVLLLTLRGNNFVGMTVPGKLQTYMTTGKPVLGAVGGGASDIIRASGCGKSVPAGDHKGLARLMNDFTKNPTSYSECGANGKRYFLDNFTKETFVTRLERELAGSSRAARQE